MNRILGVTALVLGLSACGGLPDSATPVAQQQIAGDTTRIQSGIVKACTGSGLFKAADGALSAAVPAAALPVMVVNAGVDQVCADPKRFANDAGVVEWTVKNLAAEARRAKP